MTYLAQGPFAPIYKIDEIDARVIATQGEGAGDDKEFPKALVASTGELLTFFADGTDHYDGHVAMKRLPALGEIIQGGLVSPGNQANLPASYTTRNHAVGKTSNGTLVVMAAAQINTVAGDTEHVYTSVSTDDGATWSDWSDISVGLGIDADVWFPGHYAVETTQGLTFALWRRNGTRSMVTISVDVNGANPTLGTVTATPQGGDTSISEVAIVAVTTSNVVAITRHDDDGETFGFLTSTDGGDTWTLAGTSTAFSGTTNSHPGVALAGDDVIVVYANRSASDVLYRRMDAAAFHTDPDATFDAASEVALETELAGSTFEKGYPFVLVHEVGTIRVIIFGWYEEGPADAGDSAQIVLMRTTETIAA